MSLKGRIVLQKFFFENLKFYKECMSVPSTFLPPRNFTPFGRCYFRGYCLQRAENCTSCPRFTALQFWTFCGLTRFVMSINVDDEVHNDSSIKEVSQRRATVSCRLKMCLHGVLPHAFFPGRFLIRSRAETRVTLMCNPVFLSPGKLMAHLVGNR